MICGTKLRIYKTIFTRIQPNSLFLIALKNKKHFDIIICGGGAAGLLLAHGLIQNNAFDHLSIVLIEKERKNQNDRTWCFFNTLLIAFICGKSSISVASWSQFITPTCL